MAAKIISKAEQAHMGHKTSRERVLSIVAWIVALSLAACAIFLGWRLYSHRVTALSKSHSALKVVQQGGISGLIPISASVAMPDFSPPIEPAIIQRRLILHTVIPNRPRQDVLSYIVQSGDSIFEIAAKFNIKPETVLWSNYSQLKDNPDLISIGMELQIPPADGLLYEWTDGDTLDAVAARFEANVPAILNWPGNSFDLTDPSVEPGTLILIPGGQREFRQWIIPTIPRGSAGVSKSVYGEGACEGSYDGAFGTGSFIWPSDIHRLSGNDYWSGHLGIDLAAAQGAPIYASDSGVVVFAGWATGGYGYTIMIDHGNGYQTLYGHLSNIAVSCGRSVAKGGTIGYAGSTGNSTGTHLHFEIRYLGGFVTPWAYLPAP